MRIGFIGLGTMGSAAAANIRRAGYDLVVHDLREEVAAPLCAEGAQWAETPRSCGDKCDVVFTMVFGPEQVQTLMRGDSGLMEGLRPGSVWVDMTTNRPSLVRALADELAVRGIETIDAPVTGAVDGARRGELTLFVGGSDQAVERVRPVLETMGEVQHVGGVGNGTVAKLVTNQLWFIHAAAIGEALVLGKKSGIDLLPLWEAMKSGAADSFVCRHDVPSIFAGHYDPSFTLDLCCKDLALITDLGADSDLHLEITHHVRELFERARHTYGGAAGELHVAKLVEDASAVDLRVEGDWQKHWEVEA